MPNTMPIGELLIQAHYITKEQLAEALEIQKTSEGTALGDILLNLGYIDEKQLMKALEYRFQIPLVDLSAIRIPPEMSQLVTLELAREHTVVPLGIENNKLKVATSDPLDFHALDDVKLQAKMDVVPVLATKSDIRGAIADLYEHTQTEEVVEDLNNEYMPGDVEQLSSQINESVDSAPVVRLVNLIINQAIHLRASDIHIEPLESSVRVRFRIDGELHEQLKIQKNALPALITRLKIMGNMDIAEKRLPQDGRVQISLSGTSVDMRLSILPTVNGEKAVIRILGSGGVALSRRDLGFSEANSRLFDEILRSPHGLLLVSGPTGSGKSTTLYTVLSEISRPGVNVITVEDPVEYRLDGVNQVQVNPRAGLTFASGLRSILRQDPDVIMVGEIRDSETAEIAVRASITGHLVLSTIHTNDAVATISRLVDMGVKPYLVSASLVGVVAQRLVRRICPKCRTSHMADPMECRALGLSEPRTIYQGAGCAACNNTGYKGRIAVHEILLMNSDLRLAADQGASDEELRSIAAKHGLRTLKDNCAELVLAGVTTVDELMKVAYSMD